MMVIREKKEIRPLVLKFGVALALSLGGILYSIIRTKRMRPSKPPPSHRPSGELGDDYHALYRPKVTIDASISGLSPSIRSNGDEDGFLLPEFDELVKDVDALLSDEEAPRVCRRVDMDYREQDQINSLRNTVEILKERERTLEIQLLEYYGLKEQETAVMELQNRLKINNVEAKLFNLKIESLQADNRRLEAQVADYTKVVTDLETARAKIKLLKRKFRSEAEQHNEQVLNLQKRVANLQDHEHGAAVAIDPNTQLKLQKLKDLEDEAEELRKSNYSLRLENSDLAEKLEYVQILATSVLEDEETEKLKEEAHQLRKQKEDLTREIEQLQGYRCADVEELVYLRWVNACLRYELRNYQPTHGKTVARDLSKTLSPKSEEKAKQLILEYANKEGEKGTNIAEMDFDQWSSSQASCHTDPGELDEDNSSTNKSSNSTKRKFFNKLKKLLRGKEVLRDSSEERNECAEYDSPLHNSSVSTGSDNGTNNNRSRNSSQGSSRRSLDIPRSSSSIPRLKSVKSEGVAADSPQDQDQDQENARKSDVIKYAEALKDSRSKSSKLPPRRSASFSSF